MFKSFSGDVENYKEIKSSFMSTTRYRTLRYLGVDRLSECLLRYTFVVEDTFKLFVVDVQTENAQVILDEVVSDALDSSTTRVDLHDIDGDIVSVRVTNLASESEFYGVEVNGLKLILPTIDGIHSVHTGELERVSVNRFPDKLGSYEVTLEHREVPSITFSIGLKEGVDLDKFETDFFNAYLAIALFTRGGYMNITDVFKTYLTDYITEGFLNYVDISEGVAFIS